MLFWMAIIFVCVVLSCYFEILAIIFSFTCWVNITCHIAFSFSRIFTCSYTLVAPHGLQNLGGVSTFGFGHHLLICLWIYHVILHHTLVYIFTLLFGTPRIAKFRGSFFHLIYANDAWMVFLGIQIHCIYWGGALCKFWGSKALNSFNHM